MDIARKLNISQELSAFEKYHIYDKSKVRYVSKYDEFEAQSVEHSDYARNLSAIWRIWLYAKYHAITSQTVWISVKDKLPNRLTPVLAYPNENNEVFYSFFREPNSFVGGHPLVKVTHWQPLPEPPKES